MSELCMSNTTKKSKFSGHIISDFLMLFYFILSHPLYFSYIVFFSPYILKLLSFISPLFVTTSLLLVAFLTLSPSLVNENSTSHLSESNKGFLVSVYDVLEKLSSGADNEAQEFSKFEEFELYKIVFDVSMYEVKGCLDDEVSELNCKEKCIEAIESTVVIECINECLDDEVSELSSEEKCIEEAVDESSRSSGTEAVNQSFLKAMTLKELWKEKSNYDYVLCDQDEKEFNPAGAEFNKVEEENVKNSNRSGSEIQDSKVVAKASIVNDEELTSKVLEDSLWQEAYLKDSDKDENYASKLVKKNSRGGNRGFHVKDEKFDEKVDGSFSPNLSSYGSMRKEKEWRRTLACKLFEERHSVNVGGSEGMDLLWESYESKEAVKVKTKGNPKKVTSYYDDEDDAEEDEDVDGQLCCLQALKFSAGKMNLGMGRPNLVKISKAFKGIGWLQSMSRRSKKGHY